MRHQFGAARYRQIAHICVVVGVDQMLIEAWIEVRRQRATVAAAITHKACVLWDSERRHLPLGRLRGNAMCCVTCTRDRAIARPAASDEGAGMNSSGS
jgi:hypothetical protein